MAMSTSYDIQIAAENEAGSGTYSNYLTFKTPTVPGQMNAPTVDTNTITPTSILITWTAPSSSVSTCPVTGYILEYADSSGTFTALTTSTYNSLSYSQTSGFLANTNYQYRIRAVNQMGTSTTPSTVTWAQTDTVPGTMNAPVAAAADINPTNIKFTWTALTNTGRDPISHYSLEWCNTGVNPNAF